jgi:hypothetical protein
MEDQRNPMIDDSTRPKFHYVQASFMNADREIEHQGQLGTALDRKSGQRSDDGDGAVAPFVMDAVSAASAANHLYLFRCAAVSAPGCEGEIQ